MKKIVQEGDPILRKRAKPVPESMFGTAQLRKMIKDMAEALDKELDGVAIAAPQIGLPYRLFIVRADRIRPLTQEEIEQGMQPMAEIDVYINPEIIKTSRKKHEVDEGCLSCRGLYGKTKRHERVTLRARREDGTRFTRGAGDVLAQIFEHESDHLEGVLFIDHATHLVELALDEKERAQG